MTGIAHPVTASVAPTPGVHPFADRPQTLAEVVRRSTDMTEFSYALAGFLDTFYGHVKRRDLAAATASLEDEPQQAITVELHAYFGGVAEHLSRRWGLPTIPAWVEHPTRFLKSPLFGQAGPATRYIYLEESPLAFRRRLIFTEAVPLRRARMPINV
jgi:hypothetical protein